MPHLPSLPHSALCLPPPVRSNHRTSRLIPHVNTSPHCIAMHVHCDPVPIPLVQSVTSLLPTAAFKRPPCVQRSSLAIACSSISLHTCLALRPPCPCRACSPVTAAAGPPTRPSPPLLPSLPPLLLPRAALWTSSVPLRRLHCCAPSACACIRRAPSSQPDSLPTSAP